MKKSSKKRKELQRHLDTISQERNVVKKDTSKDVLEIVNVEEMVVEVMCQERSTDQNSAINDIKKKRQYRLDNAKKLSVKVSEINRYLVFTGFAVIWALLSNDSFISRLLTSRILILAMLTFGTAIVFDLFHYIIGVSSNLYYATKRLYNKRSYDNSNSATNKVASIFPPKWERTQWTLWYIKVSLMCIGYFLIVYFLFDLYIASL